MKKALLVVDVQNDFCPSGSLPVKQGDQVVAPINTLTELFTAKGLPMFFTMDWHPADHSSFKEQGGIWPAHCIAESRGAELHPKLLVPKQAVIVCKGLQRDIEAYSGFNGTDLERRLRFLAVEGLTVCGLATDYCIKNTVLDALKAGFYAELVTDAVRAVDAQKGDGDKAIAEMKRAGAAVIKSYEVILG